MGVIVEWNLSAFGRRQQIGGTHYPLVAGSAGCIGSKIPAWGAVSDAA